jgi:hypothetical protein
MRTEAINLDTGYKWEDSLYYIVGNAWILNATFTAAKADNFSTNIIPPFSVLIAP